MLPVSRYWAGFGLFVLLLNPQSRHALAMDPPPAPPAVVRSDSQGTVQIDVVIAQVPHLLMRDVGVPMLGLSGQTGTCRMCLGIVDSPRDVRAFRGFLQVLKREHLAKVVAEPQLVTASGRRASFLDGGEQAVPNSTESGQAGIRFEEVGTRLNVLPTVLDNGKIRLEMEPEISTLDPANGVTVGDMAIPGRDTQRVHTTVELEDGQTLLIGGLTQRKVTVSTIKVPVLSDLPFVGTAFSTEQNHAEEHELVILVTPRLIRPAAAEEAAEAGSDPKPSGPGSERAAQPEAGERVRRLERQLRRLQEQLADLRREIRSLRPPDPATPGGQGKQ